MPLVSFRPGDGTREEVDVAYIARDFPRGPEGTCAFCRGDPCNEDSPPDSLIARYYARNQARGRRPETCPMCEGRPT